MPEFKFPKDFYWGTATAAHQIEGDNKNSDWWAWENRDKNQDCFCPFQCRQNLPLEPSLKACDSYNRYEEDFDLCVKLNNNAVRISIEWARIQPQKNIFDKTEIEHYKKVLESAKKRNLTTFVTLHHFTNPKWFADIGGWLNLNSPKYFGEYAKRCAEEFGGLIDFYATINEPQVYAMQAYLVGKWPPQKKNPFASLICRINFIRSHIQAYNQIKKIGNFPVGIVKNIVWYQASIKSKIKVVDQTIAKFLYWLNCDFFLNPIKKYLNFIGLNYYFTSEIKNLRVSNPNTKVSDLGWWLETSGLEKILIDLKKFHLPIYITENGLADEKDENRKWYLEKILKSCAAAIQNNADLKGYFHWSLIDNYEWAYGFWPRFGLTAIDRENNLTRIPRNSFYEYAKICKNNSITI